MTKLNCFHHHRSTDVCKNTGIGKTFYSKECFLCKNSSTGCTTSASTAPVPAVATSHMTSRVCVCVRVSGWISQPYIVLCPVSKHKLAEMPQQDRFLWMTPLNSCKNNGWDGETELSSHAPARPQTARLKHVRHIETPRSAKHEANNRLYKIWPLWQQKAIAIWPSASEHGYSIHEAKRHSLDFTLRRALWSTAFQRSLFILLVPTAILQREGFWQHKGLGKNINTYYDFGCECHPDLQRLGNTKRARLLLEVDIYLGCFNWRQRRIDCLKSITLLSPQTPLMRMLSDHTRIPPQTMNSSHMLLTRKLCWLIVMTLPNEKKREIVRPAPSSNRQCSAAQGQLETRSQSTPSHQLRPASMSHQNSTPVQLCATCLCLPKSKAKENGHCQKKILPRLWTTIWQRKDVWNTLFQNKSWGTINPVYLPQTTPEQYKESVNQKTLSITNLAQYFILQLMRNIPWTTMTLIVFCFWKKCTGKKCSYVYTLDLG